MGHGKDIAVQARSSGQASIGANMCGGASIRRNGEPEGAFQASFNSTGADHRHIEIKLILQMDKKLTELASACEKNDLIKINIYNHSSPCPGCTGSLETFTTTWVNRFSARGAFFRVKYVFAELWANNSYGSSWGSAQAAMTGYENARDRVGQTTRTIRTDGATEMARLASRSPSNASSSVAASAAAAPKISAFAKGQITAGSASQISPSPFLQSAAAAASAAPSFESSLPQFRLPPATAAAASAAASAAVDSSPMHPWTSSGLSNVRRQAVAVAAEKEEKAKKLAKIELQKRGEKEMGISDTPDIYTEYRDKTYYRLVIKKLSTSSDTVNKYGNALRDDF